MRVPPKYNRYRLRTRTTNTHTRVPRNVTKLRDRLNRHHHPRLLLNRKRLSPIGNFVQRTKRPPKQLEGVLRGRGTRTYGLLLHGLLHHTRRSLFLYPTRLFPRRRVNVTRPNDDRPTTRKNEHFNSTNRRGRELSPNYRTFNRQITNATINQSRLPLLPKTTRHDNRRLGTKGPQRRPTKSTGNPRRQRRLNHAKMGPNITTMRGNDVRLQNDHRHNGSVLELVRNLPIFHTTLQRLFRRTLYPRSRSNILRNNGTLHNRTFQHTQPRPSRYSRYDVSLRYIEVYSTISPYSTKQQVAVDYTPISYTTQTFSSGPPTTPPSLMAEGQVTGYSVDTQFDT